MNTKNMITVGTHNGIFHQDEVVAIALIYLLYGDTVTVKRTRNPKILSRCDLVVDVGGGEFDHHMPGGNGVRANNIPYASAGLIWRHIGQNVLKKYGCPNDILYEAFNSVDKNIIQPVDKIDNGISASSLFDYIPVYIPNWNEDFNEVDNRFNDVLSLTTRILTTAIRKEIANISSDSLLLDLLYQHKTRSHVLEIPNQYIDWKARIIEYNTFSNLPIDFVVFPYPTGGYAAQAVPPSFEESFKQRIPFPRDWAGLTTTLPEVSGVKTATFCHNNLFFVRAETKEDVIELCKIAIDQY